MHFLHRTRAQATIEFAFVAPLFLLCFLATVDSQRRRARRR